jgi:hypothetical protein
MNQGLKARMDGTEQKIREEAIKNATNASAWDGLSLQLSRLGHSQLDSMLR